MISKHAALVALAVSAALAPANAAVTISTAPTQNMNCSGGTCEPTAPDATLNVSDLENLLASGNVEVTTTGVGIEARRIRVRAPLTWSATSSLALTANAAIEFFQPVSIEGQAALALTTGHKNEPGGDVFFDRNSSITFANVASSMAINSINFTLVDSISHLARAIAANPSGNYALASSYDARRDGTYAAPPITTTFGGILSGLGNAISNLSVKDTNESDTSVGLFAQGSGAVVRNISLRNVNVYGSGFLVGALGGYFSSSDIIDVSISGTVTATASGALAGGLFGEVTGGIIRRCLSSANISASGQVEADAGGLAAVAAGLVEVSASRTTGNIASNGPVANDMAGGLFATLEDSLVNTSFSSGKIDGPVAGGLIAELYSSDIANSYSTGEVTSGSGPNAVVGGLIGELEDSGAVNASYAAGLVRGGGYEQSGGFTGVEILSSFSSDYWDTETSHKHRGVGNGKDVPGVTGLTTEQLQSALPAGFDPSIWAEQPNINNGLPYLINNPPPK